MSPIEFKSLSPKPSPEEKREQFLEQNIASLRGLLEKVGRESERTSASIEDDRGLSELLVDRTAPQNGNELQQKLSTYERELFIVKKRIAVNKQIARLQNELEVIQTALLENNRQQAELENQPAQDRVKIDKCKKYAVTSQETIKKKNVEITVRQKQLLELSGTNEAIR